MRLKSFAKKTCLNEKTKHLNVKLIEKFGIYRSMKITSALRTAFFILGVGIPAGLFATLPALAVVNGKIVTAVGDCPVRLHGVDVSGLEYSNPPGSNPVLALVQEAGGPSWNCNFVRIPLNQDRWLGYACDNGNNTAYKNWVYAVVNWCTANNVYVLLDLHWSDLGLGSAAGTSASPGPGDVCSGGQHDMPDMNSVAFWQSLASSTTISANSAVLFDLYNEPGGANSNTGGGSTNLNSNFAGWNLWRNGGTETAQADGTAYYTPGMQGLLNT